MVTIYDISNDSGPSLLLAIIFGILTLLFFRTPKFVKNFWVKMGTRKAEFSKKESRLDKILCRFFGSITLIISLIILIGYMSHQSNISKLESGIYLTTEGHIEGLQQVPYKSATFSLNGITFNNIPYYGNALHEGTYIKISYIPPNQMLRIDTDDTIK